MSRQDDPRNPLNQIHRDYQLYRARFIAFLWSLRGRHLSNIGDPNRPHAMMMHTYSFHAYHEYGAMQQEWMYHLQWVNENLKCRPKSTRYYSTEQLEAMEMIGIYQPLLRTLGSWDQIAWWVLGFNKPKLEKLVKRVRAFLSQPRFVLAA